MAKKYKGSLSLEWFNKQKAIVTLDENSIKSENDIPAPGINWINKEEALFYELNEEEGKGNTPYWVNRDDIRVKEARPLVFQKAYKAVDQDKADRLPGSDVQFAIEEIDKEADAKDIENILIKGDNLLALNTLKKHFDKLPDNEKVKCIYIDPPFNTEQAFEHYDDNLEHSEWLTLMRDRLTILKKLLKSDGCIFVHTDDKETSYLKVLCDEIFGRENYLNTIIVKTNSPSGFRHTANDLFKSANYILAYANDSSVFSLNKIYVERDYDKAYKYIIKDKSIPEEEWEWELVGEYFAKKQGYNSKKDAKIHLDDFEAQLFDFIIENANRIFRTAAVGGGARKKRIDTVIESKKNRKKIIRHPNDDMNYQFIGGEMMVYYSDRLVNIEGNMLPGKVITDIWEDIAFEGIAKEGNVYFPASKKPEHLIRRILEISSNENDLILDCFGGSGTTFAVAHKMNRRWVGIELGEHAETHIKPRMKSVVQGADNSGISKTVDWQGGGSFKYYHLGESIINIDEETKKGEFNWSLGKQFIQESLLQSYDFVVQGINVFPSQIFKDELNKPTVGKLFGSTNKAIYGLAYLATPQDYNLTISNEEVKTIYSTLKKLPDFQSLVIYSNKGIDIAQDTIPNDLAIIKVPHAIFSELER